MPFKRFVVYLGSVECALAQIWNLNLQGGSVSARTWASSALTSSSRLENLQVTP